MNTPVAGGTGDTTAADGTDQPELRPRPARRRSTSRGRPRPTTSRSPATGSSAARVPAAPPSPRSRQPTGTTFTDTGRSARPATPTACAPSTPPPTSAPTPRPRPRRRRPPRDTTAADGTDQPERDRGQLDPVNLSWTAATDNVAVTGYRVERCQGAGCSVFTQIATPTGTTSTDIGRRRRPATPTASAPPTPPPTSAPTRPTATATTPAARHDAADGADQPDRDRGQRDAGQPLVDGRDRQRRGHRLPGRALPGCRLLHLHRDRCTPTGTTFTDSAGVADSSYPYRVRATDAATNLGPYSPTATATTPAATDTTPPTAPTGLTATAVERDAGQPLVDGRDRQRRGHRLPGRALPGCRLLHLHRDRASRRGRRSRIGRSASTQLPYRVRAIDAATNLGPYSATATATTPASTSGLVAGYAFDEGLGVSAADASGSGLTGSLTNGAGWGTGRNAGAVLLDGVNDFVELGNPALLQLTGSMTVSAWVNSAAFPGDDAAIVSKRAGARSVISSTRRSIGGRARLGSS